AERRDGVERAALALAGPRRNELRAARKRARPPVAVLRRAASGRAVPAFAAVGAPGAWKSRAVQRRRARAAGRGGRRAVPVPSDDRAAARGIQYRRADRGLQIADAARRNARSLARGRGEARRRRG